MLGRKRKYVVSMNVCHNGFTFESNEINMLVWRNVSVQESGIIPASSEINCFPTLTEVSRIG